jgi:Ca-activated chloride channel family protein
MKFGAPEFIKWLLLIIPLIALAVFMHRQRAVRLTRLISSRVWETVIPGHSEKRGRRRTTLRLFALFCIGLALTRPQWGSHWEEVKQRGLDIIVVLDTSKSMLAEDVKPNRLKQAQWAVRDFVRHLKGDRIGLVAFAGTSFLQCPVTVDYAAFTMMLDDLYAGIIPRGGTAIEQALKTAADSFDRKTEADRVIILITDGEDHEGAPLRMAEQFRKDGIKLFCIGVGTLEGELVPAKEGYVKDSQGQVVKSSLNEGLLEKLASETGGFYVRSAPGDFGLDRICRLGLAGLQRDEQETRLARVYEERFIWFAAAALLFLLAEGWMRPAFGILLLLFLSVPQADAADWAGAYRKGDYTNAFRSLEKTAEKFPDVGNYNRGNVLYRMKDFQGSEKAYGNAAAQTADDKLKPKALYNRGTALLAGTVQQNDPSQIDAKIAAVTLAAGLFEQTLSLTPDDLDAKQNLERALKLKEQLEQLKKEQEQKQQEQDQQKQEPQQDQSGSSDRADQKSPEQKQSQPQQRDQQQQSAQPQQAGKMSPEEAKQLLDAMKQDEQDQRTNLKPFLGGPVQVEKDW